MLFTLSRIILRILIVLQLVSWPSVGALKGPTALGSTAPEHIATHVFFLFLVTFVTLSGEIPQQYQCVELHDVRTLCHNIHGEPIEDVKIRLKAGCELRCVNRYC